MNRDQHQDTSENVKRRRLGWTLRLFPALGAVALLAIFVGCDKNGADGANTPAKTHEGTAASKPAAQKKPAAVAGHDGHDHGAEEPGGHQDEVKLTADAIRRYGIRIETARKRALIPTVTAPARVEFDAERMAHVGSAVTGRVAELKVRIGAAVKQGDPLIVVDSPQLGETQSDYLQRRTAVTTAQPALELAQSAFDRAQQLYNETKGQGIALTAVQQRQSEFSTARGMLHTSEAALRAAENRLSLLGMSADAIKQLADTGTIKARYTITAPIDGQVIERRVTLGELVGPEQESLLVVADLSTVWVVADVAEAQLSQIAVGAKTLLRVASRSQEMVEGTVAYVAPQLDPNTRAGKVRVEVKNEGMKLMPGMFAAVEITAAADEASMDAVLVVPEGAIQMVEKATSVFVAVEGEEDTFARRAVAVGPAVGGWVPIVSGLNRGAQVVTSGSFILKAELGKAGAAHEH